MASLENIDALRQNLNEEDMSTYAALHSEITECSESMEKTLASVEGRVREAESKRTELKAKIEALKQKKEARQKAKEVAAAAAAAASSSSSAFQKFSEQCAALYNDLVLRKAAFAYIDGLVKASSDAVTGGSANLKYADITKATEYQESWATFNSVLDKRIADLAATAKSFGDAAAGPIRDLAVAADEVRDVHAAISGPLIREIARRTNHAANVLQLRESQSQLMLWCRQQRSTMENLTEPGQIQEYTNSFQSNITVMETNFLVLMELAEPLLPNKEVNAMLEEVIEVWLSLQVFAFEKLTGTLMAQHDASGIENDLNRWLECEGNVIMFLNKAREVLTMPVDDESREVTQPILEQCDKLLADIESFNIIASHLSTFNLREANLKEYYDAIRRTIFSKLTISSQVYNGQYAFPKKQNYMDRLAELNDWVDCKSQNGAWKQLLQRVDGMKTLIEENKATHGTAEERGY